MPNTKTQFRQYAEQAIPGSKPVIVAASEVRDLRRGDKVRILGDKTVFEFICFKTNLVSGKSWAELWGGNARNAQLKAARLKDIVKVR